MKQVVYQGPSDIRILTSDDVQTVGVEAGVFKKTEFYRDQPVEVDDSVHDALIENSDVFGKFATYEEADEPTGASDDSDDEAEVEVGKATASGSNQESTGTPTGGTSGGRVSGSTGRSTTGSSSRTR
jgi:hypothetical protein